LSIFNFFKKKTPVCPVTDDVREWIEEAYSWLLDEFGADIIKAKKIRLPDQENFPIIYNGEHKVAFDTLKIVACQMDVDPNEIVINFYSEGITEIESGGIGSSKVFIGHEKDAKKSSGLYKGKKNDGKYHISLEGENLKDPVGMVATLAHEIAHIKLLGEHRLERNNEQLTDLTTIIYGLGIFNANTAFRFNSGFDQWGYRQLGYLTQIEWGYALALYAYLRGENTPQWINYLSETVKGNFKRSEQFIKANKEKIRVANTGPSTLPQSPPGRNK